MPVVESSDSTLIQGVSQQHYASRQPGQVSEQINMLSDPVTGPRRRPGCQFLRFLDVPDGCTAEGMKTWQVEIGGQDMHIAFYPRATATVEADHAPAVSGAALVLYSTAFNVLHTFRNEYIDTHDPANIEVSPLRDQLYILNREKIPAIVNETLADSKNPTNCGFFWIKSSAFSKRYSVRVQFDVVSDGHTVEYVGSYDTPDGTNDGDAAKADPEFIAQALMNQLASKATVTYVVGQAVTKAYMNQLPSGITTGTFTVRDGTLPPGLTLTNSVLSGTPTTAGTYKFDIQAVYHIGTSDIMLVIPDSITVEASSASAQYIITDRSANYVTINPRFNGDIKNIRVEQISGSTYMGASGAMHVPLVSDLPASLPATSDGWTVSVGGSTTNLQYYRWKASTKSWVESPSFGTGGVIENMPMRVREYDGTSYLMDRPDYPCRLSGDDDNNPYAAFLLGDKRITGISTYQGRLVLLAGNSVCLSDSLHPGVFTRSTVTSVVDSDFIDLAAGSMSSASFEKASQFNKDLIVWSSGHQAVLPGGSGVLTPRTAYLVTTGTSTASLYAAPIQVGRQLMYAVPSTQVGYGFGVMYPSDYSTAQYTTTSFTEHLPTYFPSLPLFIDASGASSIAVVGDGTNEIRVYQYLWQANQLMQSAWHTWRFEQRVVSAHFYRDVLHLFFRFFNNGVEHVCVCGLDHKKHDYLGGSSANVTSPYLDFSMRVTWDSVLVADDALKIALLFQSGSAMGCKGGEAGSGGGEPAKLERFAKAGGPNPPDAVRLLDPGFEAGDYWLGTTYESSITPTPPTVKDQQGRAMNEDTTRLLTYKLSLRNSGEVLLSVKDNNGTRPDYRAATIRWSDPALQYMRAMVSPISSVLCPVHAMANTSSVTFKSNSTREMNITALTYKLRLARMTRRI